MNNPFKRTKKQKKQLPPQKRSPEKCFKHMYLSKEGYEKVEAIAKLEEISKKETLERLIAYGTDQYFAFVFDENKQRNIVNKLISKNTPKIRASQAIRNLRKQSQESGLFSVYKSKKYGL